MAANGRPSLAGIERALANIRSHMAETPLVRAEILSRALDAEVWIKDETVTPISSFKLRGALHALIEAKARGGLKGVSTHSTGNHGQGVAYAARAVGVPGAIFLPAQPNPVKAAMVEAFGGTVHAVGRTLEETAAASVALARECGYVFMEDGDTLDIMEGAGTIGLELGRALEGIDVVFVPVGGGNLISGTAAGLKAVQPAARVIGVQAEGAPATAESFHAKKALTRPVDSIAEGLINPTPAPLALACMIEFVDDMILVSDQDLLAGVHTLVECAHIMVEPSGAAALAGAWQQREAIRGQRVVLLLSSSNIEPAMLGRALATPPLFALTDG